MFLLVASSISPWGYIIIDLWFIPQSLIVQAAAMHLFSMNKASLKGFNNKVIIRIIPGKTAII